MLSLPPHPGRDRTSLQLSNRRLERKVKELLMQVDDEHLSLTDQKDQVRCLPPILGCGSGREAGLLPTPWYRPGTSTALNAEHDVHKP